MALSTEKYGNNSYNKIGNVYIDDNFEDIGNVMVSFIKDKVEKECYVSVCMNEQIYGNSYEMALVLLLMGFSDVAASGTLESYTSSMVTFGEVAALEVKQKVIENLLNYKNLRNISLLP